MIRIDWQGKIGYGDICSPIAYAHNLSDKTGHHVELAFHWAHPRGAKTYSDDPETLDERADYMLGLMRPASVSITHVYESEREFDPEEPHTNYFFRFDAHNHWWATMVHKQVTDRIIICPPTENKTPFHPNKAWKDPLGSKWQFIIEQLDADVVSYRTSMDELVNKLLGCRLFIGYHGSCAWVARHLRVPMVLFSRNEITYRMFPCEVHRNIRWLSDLDRIVKSGKDRAAAFDRQLASHSFSDDIISRIKYAEDIHRL